MHMRISTAPHRREIGVVGDVCTGVQKARFRSSSESVWGEEAYLVTLVQYHLYDFFNSQIISFLTHFEHRVDHQVYSVILCIIYICTRPDQSVHILCHACCGGERKVPQYIHIHAYIREAVLYTAL